MKFVDDVPRRIDALPAVVAFVDRALVRSSLNDERRHAVQIVLEELMTNMIEYAPQGAPVIAVEIVCSQGAVDVTLTDRDVACFDPTRAPEADIDRPIGERRPGGLGLRVVRRLVDFFARPLARDRHDGDALAPAEVA